MKDNKKNLYIDYKSPMAIVSYLFFLASIPFRILGYSEHFNAPFIFITQVILPIACAIFMIIAFIAFGRRALWISAIPLSLGVLSFVFKLFIDPRYTGLLHHIACAILYSMIVLLWILTIKSIIKTKWILAAIFLAPILIHLFIEDLPILLGKAAPLPTSMWLKEGSMLCIMFALLFCTLSFRSETQD